MAMKRAATKTTIAQQRWIRQSRETTGKVGVSRFPGVSRDFPAVETLTTGRVERRDHSIDAGDPNAAHSTKFGG